MDGIDEEIDIGGEQLVGIEVVVALEQRAPQDRHQHRRHEQLRIVAQGRRLELAALDAAIDEAPHRLEPARDDVLVVELRELWVLVALGDQEPHDEGAARAGKLLDEGQERAFEEFLGGELGGLHALAEHLEMRGDDAADHRLEQLDLGLEVEIGEALAHLGAGGDVLEPCLGKALLGEFLEGRGNDLLRADLLVAPPLSPWPASARRISSLPWLSPLGCGRSWRPRPSFSLDPGQYND